jgi:hypothetical protein
LEPGRDLKQEGAPIGCLTYLFGFLPVAYSSVFFLQRCLVIPQKEPEKIGQ